MFLVLNAHQSSKKCHNKIVDQYQNRNVRMCLDSRARKFLGKNVQMFPKKYAKWYPDSLVNKYPNKNVAKYQNSNVRMYLDSHVKKSLGNNVLMFQKKYAKWCLDNLVNK